MAEYTVKAPDGKMITLQGPDGASQDEIIAQAQALYKPQAAARPAPARRPTPKRQASNQFLDRYNKIIETGAISRIEDPEQRRIARQKFDADPRVQRLRQMAGLTPVSTKEQEVRKTASERYREAGRRIGSKATPLQSKVAGASRGWFFGLPQHMQALVLSALPDAITGIPDTEAPGSGILSSALQNYNNILQTIQGRDEAAVQANLGSGLTGEVAAGIGSAGPIGGLIKQGGVRLASSGAPLLARAGNYLQELATLRKGQKLANTAKIAATGGAAGAAQAVGTGGDVVEGTAFGAAGAPVVAGLAKTAGVLTRPVRDFLRVSSANTILKRFTTATRDEIEEAATRYRTNNPGEEPTLYELLPLRDQENLRGLVSRLPARARERLAGLANVRMADISRGFGRQVEGRTAGRAAADEATLRADLTRARGGVLAAGDDDLIRNATRSPVDMRRFRAEEARAIMAPHQATTVVPDLENLFPIHDPEVATLIRSAAGSLRHRATGGGVTAGDITDMASTLRSDLAKGGIEGRNAQRAIDHLQDMLDTHLPAAGRAAREMTDTYAARSRMLEGMKEGAQTRLRENLYPESRAAAQKITNAYDTPQGTTGRGIGQASELRRRSLESPGSALREIDEIAESPNTQEAIIRNLPAEAAALIQSARDQRGAARALANLLDPKRMGADAQSAGSETIATMLAGMSLHAMAYTRLRAVSALIHLTKGIPEGRARVIVDMLFSRDPRLMQRGFRAIGNESNGAKFTKYLAGLIGQQSGMSREDKPATDEPAGEPLNPPVSYEESGSQLPDVGDSPYGEALQNVYATENPALIELVQRVKQQESGGDQSAVSPAGAIGIMQVMPDTAPEAAQLAGLPWDENAYRTDAAYNELIGIAYLSKMLHKYEGDVPLALAAYNAGPGRVDAALSTGNPNWLATLPAETQDYVAKIS